MQVLAEYTQSVPTSGRCAVAVWGAISKEGVGPLVRFSGHFKADVYCDIIKTTLVPYVLDDPFPDGCYLLQQDRSPVLKAQKVTATLQDHGVPLLKWPPNGTNMNPIENIWGTLKQNLASQNLGGTTEDCL